MTRDPTPGPAKPIPNSTPTPWTRRERCLLGLLVLAAVGFLGFRLGANSFHNGDEAKHAMVVLDTMASGSMGSLTFEGEPYFSKPPLRFWMTAALVRLVGDEVWVFRLWSFVFAVATVGAISWLGGRIVTPTVGLWAGLVLLTSYLWVYVHCARTGEIDAMLIFLWTTTLLALVDRVQDNRGSALWVLGLGAGLVGMTKHLSFVPLVWFLGLVYLLYTRRLSRFRARDWGIALGLTVAICGPWHGFQSLQHGDLFWSQYLGKEVVERGTGPADLSYGGRLVEGLRILLAGAFPWSLTFPFAIACSMISSRRFLHWTVLWVVVVWLGAAGAGLMFPWYLAPALPPLALLVGWLITRRQWAAGAAVSFAALLAMTSTSNVLQFNPFVGRARDGLVDVGIGARWASSPLELAVLVVVVAALAVAVNRWGRRGSPAGVARWALALLAAWFVLVPLRMADDRMPMDRLTSIVEACRQEDEVVLVSRGKERFVNRYYLRRVNAERVPPVSVPELVASGAKGWWFIPHRRLRELQKTESLGGIVPVRSAGNYALFRFGSTVSCPEATL